MDQPLWVVNGEAEAYATPVDFPTLLKRGMTSTQALVLHLLLVTDAHEPDPDGWINVRQAEVAQYAEMPEKYIQSVFKSLADSGIIERMRVGNKSLYRITAAKWKDARPRPVPEEEPETSTATK